MEEYNINTVKKDLRRIADMLRGGVDSETSMYIQILLLCVRRMECLFEPYRKKVLALADDLKEELDNEELDKEIRKHIGRLNFYSTSKFTMKELLRGGYLDTVSGFEHYFNAFDNHTSEQIRYMGAYRHLDTLAFNNFLQPVVYAFCQMDLDLYDGAEFMELIDSIIDRYGSMYTYSYQTNKELANIMTTLLVKEDEVRTSVTVYDPVCGSASLLNNVADTLDEICTTPILIGQDINIESVGIASLVAKCTGRNQNYVAGDTLMEDKFANSTFDYVVADIPLNMRWNEEVELFNDPRFPAGFPSKNNATLLFAQHIISKMNDKGRAVFTCTPNTLFSADEGSSNIRSWLLSNDYLDSIILLPGGVMDGVAISMYLCVLDKNKPEKRNGKVQIINTKHLWTRTKSGRVITDKNSLSSLWQTYKQFEESEISHICNNRDFDIFSLDVLQPKRGKDGEIVMKGDQKVADKTKTISVDIPSTEQDIIGYVRKNVLNHADKDAWVDFTSVKRLCVINPYQYFEEKEAQRPIEDIEMDMLEVKREMIELMSAITEQPQESSMVSEPMHNGIETCILSAVAYIQRPSGSKAIKYLSAGEHPILTVKYLRGEEEPTQFTNSLEKHILVEDGDIVMIANGANAGEILNGRKGCLSGTMMKITPKSDSVLPDYLKLLLQAKRKEIDSLTRGAAIKSINVSAVSALQLPIPPLSVQQDVVDLIAKKINAIDKLLPMLGGKAKQTMAEYRQALISDAVLG